MYVGDKVSDKLEPIHERIYAQRSGTSAHTRAVSRYVRYYVNNQALELQNYPSVESAAFCPQNIIYNNPGLSAHVCISGWDPYKGYQIYDVNVTGFMRASNLVLGGSGSTYIKGYADINWKENMTLEEARAFIVTGIQLAISRDNSSGGCIRLMNITEQGCIREMIPYSDF